MRRHGNLYKLIIADDNLLSAYVRAKKGKGRLQAVQQFAKNVDANLQQIQTLLVEKTYIPSSYQAKTLFEPKKRDVYILPFKPDRVIHHALRTYLFRYGSQCS